MYYEKAGIPTAIPLVLGVWIILAYWKWVEQGKSLVKGARDRARRFEYRELVDATDKFSQQRKLGEGGFGAVYEGTIKNQDDRQQQVAVKKINDSRGDTNAFLAELKAISEQRHKNLVRLIGWCCRRSWNLFDFMFWCRKRQNVKLFIVCELVPNGNLENHLHKRPRPEQVLSWQRRYNIVIDIGTALRYLHHECDPYILHRDIKPGNILLDNDFSAKLADFGLSRIANESNATIVTAAIGTVGYMDPQCMKDGKVKFDRSSDVYSFGIVLLEIACTGKEREIVWDLYKRSAVMDAAADVLNGEFEKNEMQRVAIVGLWCSFPDSTKRPTIVEAMKVLEANAALPDLTKLEDGYGAFSTSVSVSDNQVLMQPGTSSSW